MQNIYLVQYNLVYIPNYNTIILSLLVSKVQSARPVKSKVDKMNDK